jgi:hypothetical protein
MPENSGELLYVSESLRLYTPISDRYAGANPRRISTANLNNPAVSATAHGKSQLDYILESGNPGL